MEIGIFIVVAIFLVLPAATMIINGLTERRMKHRAEQLIALDRIARHLDVGLSQLTIGIVSKAYREGDGRGPLKQVWSVPIHYRPNDGSRGNGLMPKLKLDGTEDYRAIEDQFIKMVELDREYPEC